MRNQPNKVFAAFPGTLPCHRARPAPAPAPLVRVHQVTRKAGVVTNVAIRIEERPAPMPNVRGPQERRDATTLNEFFRKVGGLPTKSKASLCP